MSNEWRGQSPKEQLHDAQHVFLVVLVSNGMPARPFTPQRDRRIEHCTPARRYARRAQRERLTAMSMRPAATPDVSMKEKASATDSTYRLARSLLSYGGTLWSY